VTRSVRSNGARFTIGSRERKGAVGAAGIAGIGAVGIGAAGIGAAGIGAAGIGAAGIGTMGGAAGTSYGS